MQDKDLTVTLDVPEGAWITFNDNQTGLYRIVYPSAYLSRLANAIELKSATAQVRVGVQGDVFAAARAGIIPTSDFLSLVPHYKDETEYYVLSNVISSLDLLESLYSSTPFVAPYRKYVSQFLRPLAQKLGWDAQSTDGINTGTLRSAVISLLATCEDPETLREGEARFKRALLDGDDKAIIPDLRSIVYKIGIDGGADRYDLLMKRYFSHPLAEEQRRCLSAVGSSKDQTLATKTLGLLLDGTLKAQDMALVASSISNSCAKNRVLTWDWLRTNWNTIYAKFGDGLFVFASMIGAITASFVEKERADEIESFFAANPAPPAARNIQQSVEKIRAAAAWIDRDLVVVKDWLQSKRY